MNPFYENFMICLVYPTSSRIVAAHRSSVSFYRVSHQIILLGLTNIEVIHTNFNTLKRGGSLTSD